jgi:hypothetical protein
LQVLGREKAALRFVQEVPASLDQLPLGFSLQLATIETVEIAISGTEFPGLLSGVAPERLAAGQKRFNDITAARLARGVRTVEIGNGLYPTDATAGRLGYRRRSFPRFTGAESTSTTPSSKRRVRRCRPASEPPRRRASRTRTAPISKSSSRASQSTSVTV